MKRIATITYSRAYNYGSALQTYALNRYLTELGNNVKTIDYTTENQQKLYKIFEPLNSSMSIVRNLQSIVYYNHLKTHKKRFDNFLSRYVPMTEKVSTYDEFLRLNTQFDYFVCGSDQIWNAQCEDFDSNYMLSFVDNKQKCIAYAPSLGAGNNEPNTVKALATYVNGFKSISSREKSSVSIIENATGCHVEHVVDPVFLLDSGQWIEIMDTCPVKGEYILGYFIGNVTGMREFAAQFSKESNLPVVVIWKSIRDVKYGFRTYYEAGPSEFLSLIKGATYIVTNSFHAVSFSLIFCKSFWAFTQPNSSDERIRNILVLMGLTNRIVNEDQFAGIEKFSTIDYGMINDLGFVSTERRYEAPMCCTPGASK